MSEPIHFNMQAAQHNEEVRRKQLFPEYLFKALSTLTGKKHGDEIYEQVLEWKRVHDGSLELTRILAHWGKEPPFHIFDNRKRVPRRACKVCGRTFKMKAVAKMFSRRDKYLCLDCARGWRSSYGKLGKDGS